MSPTFLQTSHLFAPPWALIKDPCAQPDMFGCGWKKVCLIEYMEGNLTKVGRMFRGDVMVRFNNLQGFQVVLGSIGSKNSWV